MSSSDDGPVASYFLLITRRQGADIDLVSPSISFCFHIVIRDEEAVWYTSQKGAGIGAGARVFFNKRLGTEDPSLESLMAIHNTELFIILSPTTWRRRSCTLVLPCWQLLGSTSFHILLSFDANYRGGINH